MPFSVSKPEDFLYVNTATLDRVVDGDTFYLNIDMGFKITFKDSIRLYNIDTPEIYKPKTITEKWHGRVAKDVVTRLLEGNELIVKTTKNSSIYSRYEGIVWIEKYNDFLDKILLELNLAKLEDYPEIVEEDYFKEIISPLLYFEKEDLSDIHNEYITKLNKLLHN